MKKKHLAEIKRISDSIPTELLKNLIKQEPQFATLKEIATRGLEDPDVSEKEKIKLKAMLDSGVLDRTVGVPDPDIEKQIEAYLDAEFEKARKLGRLPPPQKASNLKSKAKKIYVSNAKTKNTEEAKIED